MGHSRTGFALILAFGILTSTFSQTSDSTRPYEKTSKDLFATALRSGQAYSILTELSVGIGPRLSGSEGAAKAVEWMKKKMETLGFQNVHLEQVMVPHWVRGNVEEARIGGSKLPLTICALGGSIGTPSKGITAEVVEVKSFEELQSLGDKAKGKIIFFNRPMDRSKITTFEAYGGAVNQRGSGAVEAAKVGGVAAIVRSMTTVLDDVPHTGAMRYVDSIKKVPAAAVSTVGAERLSDLLKKGPVKLTLKLSCSILPDAESANVVGELTGSEKPEEVIVIGGHLDSWDKGRGAHDDGSGIAHVLEALRLLKEAGLAPKRTIRVVGFMNEENGTKGGIAYAAKPRPGEKHIAALETDAGGFSPRGFGVTADSLVFGKIAKWAYLFEPIEADRIRKGGGGADISDLGKQGVPMIGLRVDGQRYFDYHHSAKDTIDKVNERELELGAASIAALTYVLAQEGL
jgi:Zn-dependent M28 family amino/carboxypeptidase